MTKNASQVICSCDFFLKKAQRENFFWKEIEREERLNRWSGNSGK